MTIIGVVDSLHLSRTGIRACIGFYETPPKTDVEELLKQTIWVTKEDPLLQVGDEVYITIERKYK